MACFSKTIVLLLALTLVTFSVVSGCGECDTGGSKPNPKPDPKPTPTPYPGTPSSGGSPSTGGGSTGGADNCPRDALKLGVCANVLNILTLKLGSPPKEPCCPLVQGLIDAEAAVCLCTNIKLSLLGIINLNIPLDLSLLVNYCGRDLPRGFMC